MDENSQQNPEQLQKLLWFVFLSSISVFYFIANFTEMSQANSSFPKFVLLGIATMMGLTSFYFRKKALSVFEDHNIEEAKKAQAVLSFSIITWAMSEFVAMVGFVTCITTGDLTMGNALITVGLVMLGLYRPIVGSHNSLQKSYKNDYKQ
ncbi:MAG: hypothetical protein CME65_07750 [Halobacteriovoraceae bacterium]|nr:hypothetical protein [Halobacteriovoraceae bacterium]|tara:strand:- start:9169 stop:9618 length:450 start_codon:yes stop_codon:yes gene_type:complete